MALWLSRFGIRDHAGKILFLCVAAFGFFTVVFGLSTWLPLSIFALIMMGTFDMVSVYVRETLMQLWTPDDVRGRVNAVNRVFIGASNELGEFRAGSVAALLQPRWRCGDGWGRDCGGGGDVELDVHGAAHGAQAEGRPDGA